MICPMIDWQRQAIEYAIEHLLGTDLANDLISTLDNIDVDADLEDDDTELDNADMEIECHPGMGSANILECCRCCGHETHTHQDFFHPEFSL